MVLRKDPLMRRQWSRSYRLNLVWAWNYSRRWSWCIGGGIGATRGRRLWWRWWCYRDITALSWQWLSRNIRGRYVEAGQERGNRQLLIRFICVLRYVCSGFKCCRSLFTVASPTCMMRAIWCWLLPLLASSSILCLRHRICSFDIINRFFPLHICARFFLVSKSSALVLDTINEIII